MTLFLNIEDLLSLNKYDYRYRQSSFAEVLKILRGEKMIAWNYPYIYCCRDNEFTPFSHIPAMPTVFIERILNTIFIMKNLVESIEKVINGEPLSREKVTYPFNIPEIIHTFKEPGIIMDGDYYKLIPDKNGQIMLDKPFKLSEKISSVDELIKDYKKDVRAYKSSLKKQYDEYLEKLSHDLKKKFIEMSNLQSGNIITFYKNQHWSVLYSRNFDYCYVNLECPPYILEERNHKFYGIERSVIGHDIQTYTTKRLIADLENGFIGMLPYIAEPRDFVHPFCSGDRVCTAGFADLETKNPNFFSGIIETLLGTRQILRSGYSDFRFSIEQRFKPFKSLSMLPELKRIDSLGEAKKFGLPIYRYYIEDRE